jgi:plastocyanin
MTRIVGGPASRWPAVLLTAVALAATVSACGATRATSRTAPAQAAVVIQDFAFHPSVVTVKQGGSVSWENRDTAHHTSTSDAGSGLTWDTGILRPGRRYRLTFDRTGSFPYHCDLHPFMHGVVHVRA